MPLIDTSVYGRQQNPDLMGAYQQGLRTRGLMRQDNAEQQKAQRMKAFEQAFDQASRGLDLTNPEHMGNTLKQTFQAFPDETMETAKRYQEAFPQAKQAKAPNAQFQEFGDMAGVFDPGTKTWSPIKGDDGQPLKKAAKPAEGPSAYQISKDKWEQDYKDRALKQASENAARTAANAAKSAPVPGQVKLNNAQAGTLAEISEAKTMVDNIVNSFNKSGMAASPGAARAADVVESIPFIGGKLAPKTSQYNDDRRITAEKFLRAATGAAAPDAEVAKYSAMLPEPGDTPTQAQSAVDSFRGAVKAKAMSVADALDLEGRAEEAANLRARLEQLFSTGANIEVPEQKPKPAGLTVKPPAASTGGWTQTAPGIRIREKPKS